jgi:hypothetical protein
MKASKNAKKTIQKTSVKSTHRKALKPPSAHDKKAFGFFEKRVTKGEETIGNKKYGYLRCKLSSMLVRLGRHQIVSIPI